MAVRESICGQILWNFLCLLFYEIFGCNVLNTYAVMIQDEPILKRKQENVIRLRNQMTHPKKIVNLKQDI